MPGSSKYRFALTVLILTSSVTATACVRNRSVGPQIQDSLFATGISALHEGTPDGYRRAAEAFGRASVITPGDCEYELNLAQALLLLAEEQRLNWEEFEPTRTEAIAAVDLDRCSGNRAFATRVRALIEYPRESAIETIERALGINPRDPLNWVVYWKLAPDPRRTPTIDRPEELDPDSALVQWSVGRHYQRLGEPERATASFGRALVLNPRHFRAFLGMGHLALGAESPATEAHYEQAVRISPEFLEGLLALGNYYVAIDEVESAMAQFEAAIDSNAGYHPAHFSMGTLLLDIERPDDAEPHFRDVIRLNESNADAYYYLGNIQYLRDRFAWAQIQYELALAWEPRHVNAAYGYGKTSQELGDLDEALSRYEHVIEISPQFPDAYFSRASVRSLREEYEEAVRDYGTATSVGEREILQTEARIRVASRRSSLMARSERRRLEDYKEHLEELMSYTDQNRVAVETYLRQLERYERKQ